MKTLRFKILIVIFFLGTCKESFAQFSLGADAALPAGALAHGQRNGIGGDLRFDGKIVGKLKWSLGLGYYSLPGKAYSGLNYYPYYSSGGYGPTENFLSLLVGIKYFIMEGNKSFYIGLDAGKYERSYNSSQLFFPPIWLFGYAPGLGYRLKKVDFSYRFNLIKNYGEYSTLFSTVRIAYIF